MRNILKLVADAVFYSMVVAYGDREETESPYLFRTYRTEAPPPPKKNQRRYGEPSALPIFQVARATSAAPNYFRPITIETENGKEKVRFKDGGFGSNNPSEQIYRDVVHVHGNSSTQNVGPFVSIGAGTTPMHRFSRQKSNISDAVANAKGAVKLVSRTYETHERMLDYSRDRDEEKFPYYRFDGGNRLGEVRLDEWKTHNRFSRVDGRAKGPGGKTLDKIYVSTAAYLQRPEIQEQLGKCAKTLVQRRRLRARDLPCWDRYACFSFYQCDSEKGCDKTPIRDAKGFGEHLKSAHRIKTADKIVDKKIRKCWRCHWVYRPSLTEEVSSADRGRGTTSV